MSGSIVRGGWSSRPVTKGRYDIEELVFEEVLDERGVPVAFVVDTFDADGNEYGNRVRAAIVDAGEMLDLLAAGLASIGSASPLYQEVVEMLRKHGRL